jgi:hypothetical protein
VSTLSVVNAVFTASVKRMTQSPSPSRNAVPTCFGKATARVVSHSKPIDDDEQLLREGDVDRLGQQVDPDA